MVHFYCVIKRCLLPLVLVIAGSFFNVAQAENFGNRAADETLQIAYIVSDIKIPFWNTVSRGIHHSAKASGYDLVIYDASNSVKVELEQTVRAIKNRVDGIIISPQTSSSCAMVLKLAKEAGIPVVIADIGTDSGEYISYISSDNQQGAYDIGRVLVSNLQQFGWADGEVGIIAIPQKRLNGQARTAGFMNAMLEGGIASVDIKQMKTFSQQETYDYSVDLIKGHPNLRAIWLQTSHTVPSALRAISDLDKKGEVALIAFDAEPEFPDLIEKGIILGSAMQQPYLMGQEALLALDSHLMGKRVEKHKQLPILSISKKNVAGKLSLIQRTVLGY
jgi:ribose transport system substrate-binding protein